MVRHDIQSEQGFFAILLAKAIKPQVRTLAFEPALPPADAAELFELAPRHRAMKLDQLSLSADRPVVFAANWLTPYATTPRCSVWVWARADHCMGESKLKTILMAGERR